MSETNPEKVVIVDSRFFVCGEKAPDHSRFKGTITSESLIGYSRYTDGDTRGNSQSELGMRDDGYMGYTDKNGGSTISYLGWLDDRKRSVMKDDIQRHFRHKGQPAWEFVFALPSYEYAHEAGLYRLEDYSRLICKVMPKVFKRMGLDEKNVIWWADVHFDTSHPHAHIVWMERNPSRVKGRLREKELNAAKAYFNEEVIVRRKFEKEQRQSLNEFMRTKDDDAKRLIHTVAVNTDLLAPKIASLRNVLPRTGRLQYNAKNMLPYRKLLDRIIGECFAHPDVKPLFDEYIAKLDLLEKTMNGEARGRIATIKRTEIKKLYSAMGNEILRQFKAGEFHPAENDYIGRNVRELSDEVGDEILRSYDKKVRTKYTRNKQPVREYYSEKHLRPKMRGMLGRAISEKERELDEWTRMNGIDLS